MTTIKDQLAAFHAETMGTNAGASEVDDEDLETLVLSIVEGAQIMSEGLDLLITREPNMAQVYQRTRKALADLLTQARQQGMLQ